jgi:hypothetical protein
MIITIMFSSIRNHMSLGRQEQQTM